MLVIPAEQWVPAVAAVKSLPGARRPDLYVEVCKQFGVTTHPRYQPKATRDPKTGRVKISTYCNIFVWDVTRAMGVEIPHWVDFTTKSKPVGVGKGDELDANEVFDWLVKHGPSSSWYPANASAAGMLARAGRPVVAAWRNPSGASGHIAMVLPGLPPDHLVIAQAGAKCLFNEPITKGFGDLFNRSEVRFFAAD